MKIYLLRHGETDWNREGRFQGRSDVPMNEKGEEQVKTAGEYFRLSGENIGVIVSSPLVRARKSAEIIAEKIGYKKDIIIERDFTERSFGAGEGLTKEERAERFPDGNYPGKEPVEALFERAGTVLMKCVNMYFNETVLITAHSSILKAAMTSATNGAFPYNEGRDAFGGGWFYILEYDGTDFTVISPGINPREEIAQRQGI